MKRLYRSRSNRVIAGVCGGIGEYLNIDPVIIRIAWIIFALINGAGVIAYIIAWVVIPDEKTKSNLVEDWAKEDKKKREKKEGIDQPEIIIALFLIVIGSLFLLNNLGFVFWSWGYSWAILLIIIGLIIILSRSKQK